MASEQLFLQRVKRFFVLNTVAILLFVAAMGVAERYGVERNWIGFIFITGTMGMYALLGAARRTADVSEYYVAGRKVPAVFNGMAIGADWVSAATFLGLGGALFAEGYQGLAFILGWSGGFVLVALLFAPYLRRFGQFTIPDFLAARYGGNLARALCVVPVVIASSIYLVAQVYAVGLITARYVGLSLEVGILVGLAGILVCSFTGGMRAVTWTQAAQYIVLAVAYLLPLVILSTRLTGVPVPQLAYGAMVGKLSQEEQRLRDDPAEHAVREVFEARAAELSRRIEQLPQSLDAERVRLRKRVESLRESDSGARDLFLAERAYAAIPRTAAEAAARWESERNEALRRARLAPGLTEAFPGETREEGDTARRNFLALVICLMVGTASLPHLLMRYYTTPSVQATRASVLWSLVLLSVIYTAAPAYAVFAKWLLVTRVVGTDVGSLPDWVPAWGRGGLLRVEDINGDGRLQFAELSLSPDALVLLTPELAGLPYVISGLVASGGLASALAAADGLLLTVANALSHDVYFRLLDPRATIQARMLASKSLVLLVAIIGAYAASLRPDSILFVVAIAFSLAAAGLFPALVCGVFWSRANRWGAVAGMVIGFTTTLYYIVRTVPLLGGSMNHAWLGIGPEASGVFGIAAGFTSLFVVSLLTQPPSASTRSMVEAVRYPPVR